MSFLRKIIVSLLTLVLLVGTFAGNIISFADEATYTDAQTGFSVKKSDMKSFNVNIPAVMYHKFSDNPAEFSDWCISSQQLREDFAEFEKAGFTPVTISEYRLLSHLYKTAAFSSDADFAVNAKNFFDAYFKYPNPILITVDDGYKDSYTILFPLLKEFGFKANVAIVGLYSQGGFCLTPDEMREMHESGLVEFGNHTFKLHEEDFDTLNEMYNSYASLEEVKVDFVKNEEYISGILGEPSAYFTYPYGLYSDFTEEILNQMGVAVSLTTNSSNDIISLNSETRKIPRINRELDVDSKTFTREIIKKVMDNYDVDMQNKYASLANYLYDYEYALGNTEFAGTVGNRTASEQTPEEIQAGAGVSSNPVKTEAPAPQPQKTVLKKDVVLFMYNDIKYEFDFVILDGVAAIHIDNICALKGSAVPTVSSVCQITFNNRRIEIKPIFSGSGLRTPLVTRQNNIYIPVREFFEKTGFVVVFDEASGGIVVY